MKIKLAHGGGKELYCMTKFLKTYTVELADGKDVGIRGVNTTVLSHPCFVVRHFLQNERRRESC